MPLFKILQTIVKTTARTMRDNRKGLSPDWQYKILTPPKDEIISNKLFVNSNPQFLKSSVELKQLMFNAIKGKKKENAQQIVEHIRYHKVNDIENYKRILRTIKKAFNEIDITDLL